ncbi:response regulator [Devosia sp. 1566]|uniref:response regulator n=1 Tax=Devosia sp. 1566 TaxID=2499144 RepID=UPI0024A62544|nr:response regulator [Devosia sp. 1566]
MTAQPKPVERVALQYPTRVCVMSCRILVVEDEIFVATEIEHVIAEMGHQPVGIAADQRTALSLAATTDVALVDLNLEDGPTGAAIGRALSQTHGVTVLFMTANPSQLGTGIPGTLGVLPKPVTDKELRDAVGYAVARRQAQEAAPPRRLQLFDWLDPTPEPTEC